MQEDKGKRQTHLVQLRSEGEDDGDDQVTAHGWKSHLLFLVVLLSWSCMLLLLEGNLRCWACWRCSTGENKNCMVKGCHGWGWWLLVLLLVVLDGLLSLLDCGGKRGDEGIFWSYRWRWKDEGWQGNLLLLLAHGAEEMTPNCCYTGCWEGETADELVQSRLCEMPLCYWVAGGMREKRLSSILWERGVHVN